MVLCIIDKSSIILYYNNMDYKSIISEVLKQNNIEPTQEIFEKLEKYYSFLIEYNKNVNLTAIVEKEDVFLKHFADSMQGVSNYKTGSTVCDIGTGAGFPGVVLKIIRPDLDITLVDSLNKRIVFLNQLIELLGLNGIRAIHTRVEDVDFKNKYLNSFDYVVARAVAKLNTLAEYCLPFVCAGGYFVAYKSLDIEDEICTSKKAIKTLGGSFVDIKQYKLTDDIIRNLVCVKKEIKTSNLYPRDKNKPRTAPIE